MSDVAMDVIDINRIMEMIRHRYPILLVDRMEEVEIGESAVGIKNVTMNEPHFMGHFPQKPIMPGVLIVEAMAQTAAILVVPPAGRSGRCAALKSDQAAAARDGVEIQRRGDCER